MITGIILAGGYSSRAQTNKMLLELEGKTVINHVIETMQDVCQRIIVVTGHYHEEMYKDLQRYPSVTVIQNHSYDAGMFSSVICGVKQVTTDFFLVPGDYPNITKTSYEQLLKHHGVIRVPTYHRRKGHPIFIEQSLIKELLNEPIESNLKIFRDRHDVTYIETEDEGILQDIDTIEDYYEMLKKKERVENV